MTPQEMKQTSLTLMQTSDAVYLATFDADGFPDIRAMLNLRNPTYYPGLVEFFAPYQENFGVYLSTNTSSEKIRQITVNPKASLYYCQPRAFHGVTLTGNIEIVTDFAIKQQLWQAGWECYYPGGVEDPDYAILRLLPMRMKGWYKLNRFSLDLGGNHEKEA